MKYYSLKKILEYNAQYNMIIGERSNGKSYSALNYGLEQTKKGKQFAVVRRWLDDFKGKRGAEMFSALVANGEIEKATNGKWDKVYYYSQRWYFAREDENGKLVHAEEPFAYAFALTAMEHDKSTSYPNINTIIFDEVLTRGGYLPDEFVLFMNVISTIVRHRNDVKIFMLGNTVNKYCPYFKEMGLRHIKDMKPNDIDVYTYGDSDLRVAVEYSTIPNKQKKSSDTYFAFNNPKLKMITSGVWEIDIYPHCPYKYKPKDIKYMFFICFDENILQCEIIAIDKKTFLFIHRKTTEIKDADKRLIYSTEYSALPNYRRKITKAFTDIEKVIQQFFIKDKVFYADNEVGDIVNNYLEWCKTN